MPLNTNRIVFHGVSSVRPPMGTWTISPSLNIWPFLQEGFITDHLHKNPKDPESASIRLGRPNFQTEGAMCCVYCITR